ncbi:MAG TPA: GNAT family N-acetyltransferase [Polyangiaceae bacterium]|nr:GNAT family N-acetyltransferase [Polyangiaceae bacterium]
MGETKLAGPNASAGYGHPRYAQSHRELGVPRELPRSGGWILVRPIPGFPDRDGTGCYPLFGCRDWAMLKRDVDELESELVSLTVVTDPFGDYAAEGLRECFPDLAVPFKKHYVIDLSGPGREGVSAHHRRYARKALKALSVRIHPDPPAFLENWMALHRNLVAKYDIRGPAAFSRAAFAEQLATPGMVVLVAEDAGGPVAAMLVFVEGAVANAHVWGCTERGYRSGAPYALVWSAMDRLPGNPRWLNLMGVPGVADSGSEGIRRFKSGWTGEVRTAWLCGRVLDRERYAAITAATGRTGASYFPAYRASDAA